jgi:hypothetical protein
MEAEPQELHSWLEARNERTSSTREMREHHSSAFIMKTQLSLLHQIRILVIILLALGIYFRFNHLDLKPYWQDETYTLLRLSGYKLSEAIAHLYTGHVITVAETHPFQQLSDRGAIATIQ